MSGNGGFLTRWARRKTLARAGAPLPPEPGTDTGVSAATASPAHTGPAVPTSEGDASPQAAAVPRAARSATHDVAAGQPAQAVSLAESGAPPVSPARVEPVPTLDDVARLTPQSDFSRFVQPQVPPPVRNAALRKLFADPHFNVMDGLDVYIDDYSKPDPLPAALARQLLAAQFVPLFDEPANAAVPAPDQPTAPVAADTGTLCPAGDASAPARATAEVPSTRLDARADAAVQGTAGARSDPLVSSSAP